MAEPALLTTRQVASFAARGFLRFDAVVPESINQAFLTEIGRGDDAVQSLRKHYAKLMARSAVPVVPAETLLADAYPESSALHNLIHVPAHHGTWHGGGMNRSNQIRSMFKIRLCARVAQTRLWDTSDLSETQTQRPIFWSAENEHA